MALVYLWRTLAIRLSKIISKFCTPTFNPSERCCALPFQRAPCSGAGLAVSRVWHSTSRVTSTRSEDTVNSDTVHPLRMSAHLNYLLNSYYITEKDSKKKSPPNLPEEEMNRETLRFLIPPKSPSVSMAATAAPERPCTTSILIPTRKYQQGS